MLNYQKNIFNSIFNDCIVTLLFLSSFNCLMAQEDKEPDLTPAWVGGDCTSFWGEKLKDRVCDVGSYSGSTDIADMRAKAIEAAKNNLAQELEARVQAVVEHYSKSHHGHKDFGKPTNMNLMKNTSQKITNDAMQLSEINVFWITPKKEVYALVSLTVEEFDDAVGRMEFLSEELRKELHKRVEQIIEYEKEHLSKSLEKEQENKWHFKLSHYFWAASIHGNATIGPVSLERDAKFSEIFENLKYAIPIHFEFGKNRWTLITDFLYTKEELNLTAQHTFFPKLPDESTVDFKADYTVTDMQWEVLGAYLVTHKKSRNKVDVLLGARYTKRDNVLELTEESILDTLNFFPFSHTTSYFDPLIGARYKIQFYKNWGFYFKADIGGFNVGSKFTSNMITRISYQPVRFMDIELGYRWLYVDYENNKDGIKHFEYKSHEFGPVLQIAFKW